jgi:HEPN domain-containing protein
VYVPRYQLNNKLFIANDKVMIIIAPCASLPMNHPQVNNIRAAIDRLFRLTQEDRQRHLRNVASDMRDYADRDYLGARVLFKNGCHDQFLVLAQQCIEKYLKSILMYSSVRNTKGSHNLITLLSKCESTVPGFKLSPFVKKQFVSQISGYEATRYPTFPFYARTAWLTYLDACVWQLRFFCQFDDRKLFLHSKKVGLEKTLSHYKTSHQRVIFDGELEKILFSDKPKNILTFENLTWRNSFYNKTTDAVSLDEVLNQAFASAGIWARNNYIFCDNDRWRKDVYISIKDFIYFPKNAVEYFDSLD